VDATDERRVEWRMMRYGVGTPRCSLKEGTVETETNRRHPGEAGAAQDWWTRTKEAFPLIVGAVALGGLAFFVAYLVRHLSLNDTEWNRAIYLFGSVEAVAFAAAGYLFGKEVHRQRAENAEDEAKKLGHKAGIIKGEILAKKEARIKTLAAREAGAPLETDLDELADLAERLFPSRS
jgi:hypothetical protein